MLPEKEFLERLKTYIEQAELRYAAVRATSHEESLKTFIENNAMPAVYNEVLERLAVLDTPTKIEDRKCPECGNPLRDTYSYTERGVTFITCPWCQGTWSKSDYDAMLAGIAEFTANRRYGRM